MFSMSLNHWKKEECHWIFSGYKVNVMFILSESCSPGLLKSENIFMVCLQTAGLKRETGKQLHTIRNAQLQVKAWCCTLLERSLL